MIKLKFRNKNKELDFFKDIHFLSERLGYNIKYAEMVNDLDAKDSDSFQDKNCQGCTCGDQQR